MKLPYGTTLTGKDEFDARGTTPTSGWPAATGTAGEVLGMYPMLATVGTAGDADIVLVNDGENIFAPGLSLNS